MLSRFREHFGTAGLIVAVVALVAALAGGALAAGDGGGTGASASKAKAKAGPPGPRGPKGAKGATGATGAQGVQGAPGVAGAKGAAGTNGTNGAGASVSEIPLGEAECGGLGGALVEAQNKVEVCNGEEGAPGAEGEPWSPNSALPTGATETGTYTFNATAANAEFYVPISFPIQLKNPLEISHVHFGTQFEAPFNTICTGSLIKPTAPSGDLCIYKGETANATYVQTYEITLAEEGASRSGAVMIFNVSGAGFGIGSWAVTGE